MDSHDTKVEPEAVAEPDPEPELRPNRASSHSAPPTRGAIPKPDGIGRVLKAMKPSVRNQERVAMREYRRENAPVQPDTTDYHLPSADDRRRARNKRKAARRG